MAELKIGLIGAGWMGKTHSMAYRAARLAFGGNPAEPVLEVVADANEAIAARAAAELGFRRHARDWREVVEDPAVDVVDVTTPNDLHFEVAMARATRSVRPDLRSTSRSNSAPPFDEIKPPEKFARTPRRRQLENFIAPWLHCVTIWLLVRFSAGN